VDAKESKIYPTDQNEQSVLLSAGAHDVEFRFLSPASVAGMLISCFTALLIGLMFLNIVSLAGYAAAAIVAMILASIGFFIFWKHSLYNGQDLQTRYVWVSIMVIKANARAEGLSADVRALALDSKRCPLG